MDYSKEGRLRRTINEELQQIQRTLGAFPTLKERVLGVRYILNRKENGISMLYSTRKLRRQGRGAPVVGDINLRRLEDGQLSLYGMTSIYNGRASELFEKTIRRISHQFNVPTYFNFSE